MNSDAQAARELRLAIAGLHAKQKFVVLATAEREGGIVAHHGAVSRRKGQCSGIELGADAAALENMPEILHHAVAHVDRRGDRTNRGEPLTRDKSRGGAKEALDQEFPRGLWCAEFAREYSPADGGVAERAGHENFIADPRRVAAQYLSARVPEHRDSNRQFPRASDVSADHVDTRRARLLLSPA